MGLEIKGIIVGDAGVMEVSSLRRWISGWLASMG